MPIAYTKQESNFELIPEGRYAAVISDVDIITGQKGEKLVVKFTYEDKDTLSSKVHTAFVLPIVSDGDGFRVFADLLALAGVEAEDAGTFDEQTLVGKDCFFTIKHTEGNGKHEGKTFANVMMVESDKKK